jgi:hypothetical protein
MAYTEQCWSWTLRSPFDSTNFGPMSGWEEGDIPVARVVFSANLDESGSKAAEMPYFKTKFGRKISEARD